MRCCWEARRKGRYRRERGREAARNIVQYRYLLQNNLSGKNYKILLCTISQLTSFLRRGLWGRKHVTEQSEFNYYFASVPISKINAFADTIAAPVSN